jgi:hypothetical protein
MQKLAVSSEFLSGRYWARTMPSVILLLTALGRNLYVCRHFLERRSQAVSVLNHSFPLLVWSIGGQRELLVR